MDSINKPTNSPESPDGSSEDVRRQLLAALTSLVDRDFAYLKGKVIGMSRHITAAEVQAARSAIDNARKD